MFTIYAKSIYLDPAPDDGFRVLVDRQLPPGKTAVDSQIDLWLGQIAPNPRLQKWFGDDRDKWDKFIEDYHQELDQNSEAVTTLFEAANQSNQARITFVFCGKDVRFNTAVALKTYLEGAD